MTNERYSVREILLSIQVGNFEQAKKFTVHKYKRNPERMAYRVGQVVRELMNTKNTNYNPNSVERFLDKFTGETK